MSETPMSREQAYLILLGHGLVMIRNAGYAGEIDLCRIEADHLHNIPSLLHDTNQSRHEYYIEHERGLYLDRLRGMGATEYLETAEIFYTEPWRVLASVAHVRLSK
jgi:hypothetical protein